MHASLVPEGLLPAYERTTHKQRIDDRLSEMAASGYSTTTLRDHVREWLRFLEDGCTGDGPLPDFEAQSVARYLRRRCKTRKEGVRHVRASLRFLLSDEAAPGTRLKKRRATTPLYERIVPEHLEFQRRHRGVRDTRTMDVYLLQFFLYLDAEGVEDPASIHAAHYRAYLKSCSSRMSKGTVSGVASVLRGLARYLCLTGQQSVDVAKTIEAPRVYRQYKPIQTLGHRDIEHLLEAVDRSDWRKPCWLSLRSSADAPHTSDTGSSATAC